MTDASILPVPELKPLVTDPIRSRERYAWGFLLETVAKLAGLNVLWDLDYQPKLRRRKSAGGVRQSHAGRALDYRAVLTVLLEAASPNTIFITVDNPNKRRDYEEQVCSPPLPPLCVSFLQAALRQQTGGKAEKSCTIWTSRGVVVDIIVMEASLCTPGNSLPDGLYRPQHPINSPAAISRRSQIHHPRHPPLPRRHPPRQSGTPTPTRFHTTPHPPPSRTHPARHIDIRKVSLTGEVGTGKAVMSDARTKVLQSPQLRAVDGVKATLKIGDRQPTATGSFGSGIGGVGVGISPLVQTQFTYIDVGVNVELLARVHDNGDVSMHIDLDISSVTGHVNLGGLDQPIIGQRKVSHDIRMHEGHSASGRAHRTESRRNRHSRLSSIDYSPAVHRGKRGPPAPGIDDRADPAHRPPAGIHYRESARHRGGKPAVRTPELWPPGERSRLSCTRRTWRHPGRYTQAGAAGQRRSSGGRQSGRAASHRAAGHCTAGHCTACPPTGHRTAHEPASGHSRPPIPAAPVSVRRPPRPWPPPEPAGNAVVRFLPPQIETAVGAHHRRPHH
jgi:hypothetical protein